MSHLINGELHMTEPEAKAIALGIVKKGSAASFRLGMFVGLMLNIIAVPVILACLK